LRLRIRVDPYLNRPAWSGSVFDIPTDAVLDSASQNLHDFHLILQNTTGTNLPVPAVRYHRQIPCLIKYGMYWYPNLLFGLKTKIVFFFTWIRIRIGNQPGSGSVLEKKIWIRIRKKLIRIRNSGLSMHSLHWSYDYINICTYNREWPGTFKVVYKGVSIDNSRFKLPKLHVIYILKKILDGQW